MKEVIRQVAAKVPLHLEEMDVDSSAQLREQFGDEVPVLFIDGRKAFKYQVATEELQRRVRRRGLWRRLLRAREECGDV
jgi:hypothetical protein